MKKKFIFISLFFLFLGGSLLFYPQSQEEAIKGFLKVYNQYDQETYSLVKSYLYYHHKALSSYQPSTIEEAEEFVRIGRLIDDKTKEYASSPVPYHSQRVRDYCDFMDKYQIIEAKVIDIQYENKGNLWFDYKTTIRFKFEDDSTQEILSEGSIHLEKINLNYYVNSINEKVTLDDLLAHNVKNINT